MKYRQNKKRPEQKFGNISRGQENYDRRENSADANLDREDQNEETIERLDTEEALRLSDKIRKDDNTNRRQQKKYPDRRDDNP